jgi:hypothetical protein
LEDIAKQVLTIKCMPRHDTWWQKLEYVIVELKLLISGKIWTEEKGSSSEGGEKKRQRKCC